MAKYKFTVKLHQRIAFLLSSFSALAILWVVPPCFAQTSTATPTNLGDRFFKPQVYAQLRGDAIDGSLIGPRYAGRELSRDKVAALALEYFLKAAADRGIPEKEITKAIFEGRLNPDFDDLELAFEGLGKAEIPFSMRSDIAIENAHYVHRNRLWIARFGSIADIGVVRTIVNGKKVSRSGDDILLRLIRYDGIYILFQNFPPELVIEDLTYDQMIAQLQQKKPAEIKWLKEQIPKVARFGSAFYYFHREALKASHKGQACCQDLNLRRDYNDLRSQLYARSAPPVTRQPNLEPTKPKLSDEPKKE
jgi:hypothetical protein